MFAVVKTHNFDPETEASVFDTYEAAADYLQWIWEDTYNEEIENLSDLDECLCIHDEDYAIVRWSDGCETEFHLVEIMPARREYRDRVKQAI